ncbi:MAG: rRNA pseudouridine synthase [Lachnoanaerobaculum sp.]|uniref:pseudouridine synthase n=1 Tax=unclassified Lachnoanaerobaculum TaxID=2625085 RepID=UPI0003DFB72F|nr:MULTISPECIES: pseudouridine synthase [unclassified Lachnoanaerobaculum]ETO95206.1 pseudouridylate synthase [Lachnoanaerobaculum sp. MSX33]MBS5882659.1 rRNA pseudouridine synthase [Lachnoanaerobaculum sp.]
MIVRVDKILSELGFGSRQEIKKYVKAGKIRINDNIVKKPEEKLNSEVDKLFFEGKEVEVEEFETFILYKPAGYVCATKDNVHKTVMELIDSKRKNIVPVGRLDLDTEGILILTNDGDLNHRLVSPSSHVDKTYYAIFEGELNENAVEMTKNGLDIGEGEVSKPAKLEIISSNEIMLTIHEGKFHQVKRMVKALGGEVTYLKRVAFGGLRLDDLKLKKGESRKITEIEMEMLKR